MVQQLANEKNSRNNFTSPDMCVMDYNYSVHTVYILCIWYIDGDGVFLTVWLVVVQFTNTLIVIIIWLVVEYVYKYISFKKFATSRTSLLNGVLLVAVPG